MRKALTVLTALFLLSSAAVLTAAEEEVFDKTFSMEGVTRISIENVNGKVEAVAWDKPLFKVRAIKTASGSRAEETLRLTEIRVRKVGDEMRVETLNPNRHKLFGILDFGGSNARVDYELLLPAAVEARLQTCNGHVAASGFGAAVSADAVNGSIELKDIRGPVKATTVNGSLRISFKGALRKTQLETVNGSVEVAFDRASSIRYDLETVNGRIEGDIQLAVEGKHGPKEARGSYNGGGETLRCETVNGSIRLKTN
ncbi:MAG: DUF4097 family beta strand repeat-containing protein [Acidobacteriota bacterium]